MSHHLPQDRQSPPQYPSAMPFPAGCSLLLTRGPTSGPCHAGLLGCGRGLSQGPQHQLLQGRTGNSPGLEANPGPHQPHCKEPETKSKTCNTLLFLFCILILCSSGILCVNLEYFKYWTTLAALGGWVRAPLSSRRPGSTNAGALCWEPAASLPPDPDRGSWECQGWFCDKYAGF